MAIIQRVIYRAVFFLILMGFNGFVYALPVQLKICSVFFSGSNPQVNDNYNHNCSNPYLLNLNATSNVNLSSSVCYALGQLSGKTLYESADSFIKNPTLTDTRFKYYKLCQDSSGSYKIWGLIDGSICPESSGYIKSDNSSFCFSNPTNYFLYNNIYFPNTCTNGSYMNTSLTPPQCVTEPTCQYGINTSTMPHTCKTLTCTSPSYLNSTSTQCLTPPTCIGQQTLNTAVNPYQCVDPICDTSTQWFNSVTKTCDVKTVCTGQQTYNPTNNSCTNPSCDTSTQWFNSTTKTCDVKTQCTGQQTYNSTNNSCSDPVCTSTQWFNTQTKTCDVKTQCTGQQTYNSTNNSCSNPSCTTSQWLNPTTKNCDVKAVCDANNAEVFNNQNNTCTELNGSASKCPVDTQYDTEMGACLYAWDYINLDYRIEQISVGYRIIANTQGAQRYQFSIPARSGDMIASSEALGDPINAAVGILYENNELYYAAVATIYPFHRTSPVRIHLKFKISYDSLAEKMLGIFMYSDDYSLWVKNDYIEQFLAFFFSNAEANPLRAIGSGIQFLCSKQPTACKFAGDLALEIISNLLGDEIAKWIKDWFFAPPPPDTPLPPDEDIPSLEDPIVTYVFQGVAYPEEEYCNLAFNAYFASDGNKVYLGGCKFNYVNSKGEVYDTGYVPVSENLARYSCLSPDYHFDYFEKKCIPPVKDVSTTPTPDPQISPDAPPKPVRCDKPLTLSKIDLIKCARQVKQSDLKQKIKDKIIDDIKPSASTGGGGTETIITKYPPQDYIDLTKGAQPESACCSDKPNGDIPTPTPLPPKPGDVDSKPEIPKIKDKETTITEKDKVTKKTEHIETDCSSGFGVCDCIEKIIQTIYDLTGNEISTTESGGQPLPPLDPNDILPSNTNNNSNTTTTTTNNGGSQVSSDICAKDPTILACAKLGTPPQENPVPTKKVDIDKLDFSIVHAGKCGFDELTEGNDLLGLNFKGMCEMVGYMAPAVRAAGAYIALRLIFL